MVAGLDAAPAFDSTDAAMALALLRASATLHGGTIQFHHLIMDGWGRPR
jgi:hypothetical protein